MPDDTIAAVRLTPMAYVTPRGAIYGGATSRRGEKQLYEVTAADNAEVVSWITDGKTLPDTDRTVLIFAVNVDVELVIDGFWAEDCWHNAEGWALHQTKVPAWAEKPKGPKLAVGASS